MRRCRTKERTSNQGLPIPCFKFYWASRRSTPSAYLCAMPKKRNRNDEGGFVFSTGSEPFSWDDDGEGQEGPHPMDVPLYVSIDRKARKGKAVTLVEGFEGDEDALKELGKLLKSKCGVGGSAKHGEIMIQGEFRDKVIQLLEAEGYRTKRKGG